MPRFIGWIVTILRFNNEHHHHQKLCPDYVEIKNGVVRSVNSYLIPEVRTPDTSH